MEEINLTNNKARSKMKKTERRTFTVRNIETREAEDGTMRMAGYAAVFNEASLPLPFIERIAPGAFSKTLQETHYLRHQMFVYWLTTKDYLWPEQKTGQ